MSANCTLRVWLIACIALMQAAATSAHQSPNSAVMLDFHRDGVVVELILPLVELELAFKQPLAANPTAALLKHEAALREYLTAHVKPEADDGRAWTVEARDLTLQLKEQPNDLRAMLWMQPPAGGSTRRFKLNYSVINHEVMNHAAFVSVCNDWDTAVFSSRPEPLGSIHFTITSLDVDRTKGHWWQGFNSVLRVGMRHIADGTDHLLFLLVLLLPAPLIASQRSWCGFRGLKPSLVALLRIVTAFTVGHSLTLAIGALGWLQLPGRTVETLIAISVLVSAVHAIRPQFAGREAWVAGLFGLVHGLAFASSISEYGFSPWHLAWTVLGFNVGIELMQLAVVALTIPWLLLLARTRLYAAVRILGAVFAAMAALAWIGERALGWNNPVESLVTTAAHQWTWILASLAALSGVATITLCSATALKIRQKCSEASAPFPRT